MNDNGNIFLTPFLIGAAKITAAFIILSKASITIMDEADLQKRIMNRKLKGEG